MKRSEVTVLAKMLRQHGYTIVTTKSFRIEEARVKRLEKLYRKMRLSISDL